jgi:catechol 2,3-dioxygenase-like lactoylglutathione lyase family enzyme
MVTFKDLCIDAGDAAALGDFWARTLGLRADPLDNGNVALLDPGDDPVPSRTVWINTVPERKTVKHRVHLDVRAASLGEFADRPRLTEPGRFRWTVLADPEGGEFCVFPVDPPGVVPGYRLKHVGVDSANPRRVAEFWREMLGGELEHDAAEDVWSLDSAAGVPFESMDFAPVPEPKAVKNRIHWDVTLREGVAVDDVVALGARVLRIPDTEISWTVMADPEGNEFCVFAD